MQTLQDRINSAVIESFGFLPVKGELAKPVNLNRKPHTKTALVEGLGVNDADYVPQINVYIDGKQRLVWECPAYRAWGHMLTRAYDPKCHVRRPTYIGVTVCEKWLTFSNFRAWFVKQDWRGKHLDKDLLSGESKIYSPETCLLVSREVNNFFIDSGASRGQWPVGVSWHERDHKFKARISINGKQKFLGSFTCPQAAHRAWLNAKIEQAMDLAAEQTDQRVAAAIMNRMMEIQASARHQEQQP